MEMLFRIGFWFFMVSLMGCGIDDSKLNHDQNKATVKNAPAPVAEKTTGGFLGFVANAFEVEVDGMPYKDLEDFYTQEWGRLPGKISAAGFGPTAKVQFEAAIGFSDLWNGMDVYVSSTGDLGYQGQTVVGRNGSFQVKLPEAALHDTYKVRANKRIRLIITENSVRTVYCYNFSAREQSVPYEVDSKPVILDKFDTSLTRYDCPARESSGGLSVPQETTSTSPSLLAPGLSKTDVLSKLGSVGLSLKDSQTWCWDARQSKDSVCAVSYIVAGAK